MSQTVLEGVKGEWIEGEGRHGEKENMDQKRIENLCLKTICFDNTILYQNFFFFMQDLHYIDTFQYFNYIHEK